MIPNKASKPTRPFNDHELYEAAVLALFDSSPEQHFVLTTQIKKPTTKGWTEYQNRPSREAIKTHLRGFKQGHRVGFCPIYSGLVVVDVDSVTQADRDGFIAKAEIDGLGKPQAVIPSFTKPEVGRCREHLFYLVSEPFINRFSSKSTWISARSKFKIIDNFDEYLTGELDEETGEPKKAVAKIETYFGIGHQVVLHQPNHVDLMQLFKSKERLNAIKALKQGKLVIDEFEFGVGKVEVELTPLGAKLARFRGFGMSATIDKPRVTPQPTNTLKSASLGYQQLMDYITSGKLLDRSKKGVFHQACLNIPLCVFYYDNLPGDAYQKAIELLQKSLQHGEDYRLREIADGEAAAVTWLATKQPRQGGEVKALRTVDELKRIKAGEGNVMRSLDPTSRPKTKQQALKKQLKAAKAAETKQGKVEVLSHLMTGDGYDAVLWCLDTLDLKLLKDIRLNSLIITKKKTKADYYYPENENEAISEIQGRIANRFYFNKTTGSEVIPQPVDFGRFTWSRHVNRIRNNNPVDVVLDYYRSLKPVLTDKNYDECVTKIETFYIDHFGVDDTEYNRFIGFITFVGPAMRTLYPGCKVGHYPLLIGDTRIGKSALIDYLYPDHIKKYYVKTELDLTKSSLKIYESIRPSVLVELGEMANMTKVDVAKIKSWISNSSTMERLTWGVGTTINPHRFFIIATANDDQPPLPDDRVTAQRFLPLPLPRPCSNIKAVLDTHRDEYHSIGFGIAKLLSEDQDKFRVLPKSIHDTHVTLCERYRHDSDPEMTSRAAKLIDRLYCDDKAGCGPLYYIRSHAITESYRSTDNCIFAPFTFNELKHACFDGITPIVFSANKFNSSLKRVGFKPVSLRAGKKLWYPPESLATKDKHPVCYNPVLFDAQTIRDFYLKNHPKKWLSG